MTACCQNHRLALSAYTSRRYHPTKLDSFDKANKLQQHTIEIQLRLSDWPSIFLLFLRPQSPPILWFLSASESMRAGKKNKLGENEAPIAPSTRRQRRRGEEYGEGVSPFPSDYGVWGASQEAAGGKDLCNFVLWITMQKLSYLFTSRCVGSYAQGTEKYASGTSHKYKILKWHI